MCLPAAAVSLDEADAAIELWEHYKGRKLDQGQRLDVYVMMATRADGMWAASVTGHEKPRQSGKGDAVEVVELWDLTQRAARILHTIHDAVLLATQAQSRLLSVLEGHPDLRRLVKRSWKGTGQQMIEMRNGGVIWYRTRTGAGGRGIDDVDRVVVDEAQHAEPQHLEAITPTQAVSANPQLNALGTGALPGKSGWWWSLRKQAKAGLLAWVGWSGQRWTVDDHGRVRLFPVDPLNRDLWWQTIPGLVAGRTSMDFLERELSILGPEGFAQEYLCVWARPPDDSDAPGEIDMDDWNACAQSSSSIESHRCWALAVSPDRAWASLASAGRNPAGKLHVEWREHKATTHWVVDRCVEAYGVLRTPVRILKDGPAASFIDDLRERKVSVVEVSASEFARATGQFIDAVSGRELVHLDQPSLTKSVRHGATLVSRNGSKVWDQNGAVEITPLVACTVALGGVPTPSKSKTMRTRAGARQSL